MDWFIVAPWVEYETIDAGDGTLSVDLNRAPLDIAALESNVPELRLEPVIKQSQRSRRRRAGYEYRNIETGKE
jgi:hypothetical protein